MTFLNQPLFRSFSAHYDSEGRRLKKLLSITSKVKAKDERDRIYALLGMTNDKPLLDVDINYITPWYQVYRDVAAAFINKHQDINVRSVCDANENMPTSWVPDWRNIEPQRPNLWHMGWDTDWQIYNACGEKHTPHANASHGLLTIDGVKLSIVLTTGKTWDHKSQLSDFMGDVETFANVHCTTYLSAEALEDAIWRLCVADLTHGPENDGLNYKFRRAVPETINVYRKIRDPLNLDTLLDAGQEPPGCEGMVPFLTCIVSTCFPSLRLLSTSDGYLGFGPAAMQTGDIIGILYGASMPFILRKTSNTGQYKLIEPAYIHSNMDGEYLDTKPPPETYTFVIW